MSLEIKDQISGKIMTDFLENEKIKTKQSDKYTKIKNSISDGLKSQLKETLQNRKLQKIEKEYILKERDALKAQQKSRKEKDKILEDIISEIYDLNSSVNYYIDIVNSGFQSDNIEKAFLVINIKKEEQYRNDIKKLGPKDKLNAMKIIDEIKTLGLKISEDIKKRLTDIAGL